MHLFTGCGSRARREAWLCTVLPATRSGHGQGSRHRPGNDELGHRGDGGRPAAGHPQRGGQPDDAVGGRLPGERRTTGRPDGPTPGDPESEGDDLLREAVHRPQVRRGQQRARRPSRSTWSPVPTARRASRSTASSTHRRRSRRRCSGSWSTTPGSSSASGSPRQSSPSRRTSTTRSGRPPRTPARSPGSRSSGSSTSRRLRPWPTGWTSSRTRPCWSSTSAAARSTSAS